MPTSERKPSAPTSRSNHTPADAGPSLSAGTAAGSPASASTPGTQRRPRRGAGRAGATGRTAGKPASRGRRKGISPWVPNQHGAWAMLIAPAVIGLVVALFARSHHHPTPPLICIFAVLVAWFFGYGAFFAFGLVARAKTWARRKDYLTPVVVYGGISLVAMAVALYTLPLLIGWALFFGPLVAVAVFETVQGRSRSTLGGVSTTIASALLVPVLTQVGMGSGLADVPSSIWALAAVLAMYFSGTVPYVKSMIRARNNPVYLRGSIIYHAVVLVVVAAMAALGYLTAGADIVWLAWTGALVLVGCAGWALWRSWAYPRRQRGGEKFSPKRVGLLENPLLLVTCFAVLAVALAVV